MTGKRCFMRPASRSFPRSGNPDKFARAPGPRFRGNDRNEVRGASMKIVGFEAEGGLRLGIVEGDQVIDLQAVDSKVPADLGEVLAAQQWRRNAARRHREARAGLGAPAAQGAEVRSAGGAAGQDRLPRAQLPGARQGRPEPRQHPEISDHLPALPHLDGAARAADRPPQGLRAARLRGRADAGRRQARQAPDDGQRDLLRRRLCLLRTKARCANSSARPRSGTWARISTAPAASAPGW